MELQVAGKPQGWISYRDKVADFVPDPMILRAGDVFLMGQNRAVQTLQPETRESIWNALDRNMHGILCFFDLLATRDRIPLIDYRYSFSANVFKEELDGLTVRVDVDRKHYEAVKAEALANLHACGTSKLRAADIKDVNEELAAFGWVWTPDLGDLAVPQRRQQIAQFLLGGFVFAAYAQASGTEHILQSKRSRLFLGLSAPQGGVRPWAYRREEKLFEKLRDACRTDGHVRYEEFPVAPSVVPYVLSRKKVDTPRELLGAVLEFRGGRDGKTYRQWWQDLRGGLAKGRVDRRAERDIARVAHELDKRFGRAKAAASEARVSFELGVEKKVGVPEIAEAKGTAKVKVDNMPLAVPRVEWLRRLIVDNVGLRAGHCRVLLRLSLAQEAHENLVEAMHRLWSTPMKP